MAATMSPMPSWRSTRTASSWRFKVDTIANMGAYLSTFSTAVPTYLYATLLAGQYTTPLIYANVRAAFTHTAPVDAYRGAGRPEATFVIESIVSKAAQEMKIDAAELRRQQLHPDRGLPVPDAGGAAVQFGQLPADHRRGDQDRRLQGLRGAARRGQVARQAARHRLLVLHRGLRPGALAGDRPAGRAASANGKSAQIKFNPTGNVQVMTGSHSHGQGHETTFAQIVSDKLGVPMEQIEIVHGDTATTPFGMGTYGSRSLAVGGSAIVKAGDKIIAKGKKIAAHLMEASAADVVFENGTFKVAGTDKNVPLAQVVFAAYVPHNYPLAEARARHGRERLLRSGELRLSRPVRKSARSRSTPTPARSRS